MVELTCKKCNDVTILCDEGVVSITCSLCSMVDLNNMEKNELEFSKYREVS